MLLGGKTFKKFVKTFALMMDGQNIFVFGS